MHLSTALTPVDRERILAEAKELLKPKNRTADGWVMVATSCIEAGINLSFGIALRERSSVSSLIQISGRVNRDSEGVKAQIWDFVADDPLFTPNPVLLHSRAVVEQAFKSGLFERIASDAMTEAVAEEFKRNPRSQDVDSLREAEQDWEFIAVAEKSRLIADETVTAVVDRKLVARLKANVRIRHVELVRGSVSIRKAVVEKAALLQLDALNDERLYEWPDGEYDPILLGIMKYLLKLKDISDQKLAMV